MAFTFDNLKSQLNISIPGTKQAVDAEGFGVVVVVAA